ncbi:MAG TPA: hypothetical protein VMF69_23825 [Gemmataceae bacterium]|nr:hypothetical protein [Gemmataceae bacterium]
MNLLGPTLVLYLLVGAGVAVALYLTDRPRAAGERFLRLGTAVPFWPFYLPILLARPASPVASTDDEWTRTLAVVVRELDAALSTLNDWIGIAEGPRRRIDKLHQAWGEQAERLREMDRLLGRPEYAAAEESSSLAAAPQVRQSLAARQQNLELLRQVRRQAEADLLAALAWVRELASRIHLARFTDTPAARAEELLAALAAVVDTLSSPHSPPEQIYTIKKAE